MPIPSGSNQSTAEAGISASENLYSFLFEESTAAHIVVRPNGEILGANRALALLLHRHKKDLLGSKIFTLLSPGCRQTLREHLRQAFAGKPLKALDVELTGANNCRFLMLAGGRPPLWKQGRCKCLMLTAVDITSRKLAESTLRQSNELFAGLVEQSGDGIALVQDGRFVMVNQGMAAMTGYRREELVGMSFAELLPGEMRQTALRQYRRREQGREAAQARFDSRLVTKDSSVVHVTIDARLVEYDGCTATQVTYRDISGRRDAQRAIEDRHDQLQQLVDAFPGALWITRRGRDRSPIFLAGMEKLIGYPANDLLSGRVRLYDLAEEEDLALLERNQARAEARRRPWCEPLRVRRRDGRIVNLLEAGDVVRDSRGRAIYGVGALLDVTHLWGRYRHALEPDERLEQTMQLIDNAPIILIRRRLDIAAPLRSVSGRLRSLGYSAEQLLSGQVKWQDIILQQDREAVAQRIERHDFENGALNLTYRVADRSGHTRWLEERVLGARDAEGKLCGYNGVVLDVTDRKQGEQLLREAHRKLMNARERERRHLSESLHESVCQTLMALSVEMESLLPACARCNHQPRLAQVSQLCQGLIAQVREICYDLYPSTLDVLGLEPSLRQLLGECPPALQIRTYFDRQIGQCRCDRQIELAIYRIAQEAIQNVVRHSRANRLSLSLRRRDHRMVLVVEDNGTGFRPEGNDGLGLHLMRELAAATGGIIHVVSRPGRTRIEALIPANFGGAD
jgi:PAS domain S-box-containing protein